MHLLKKTLRQEIKYKVFLKDVPKLYAWIYGHSFFKEKYNCRMVSSLYFDGLNYDFAASNMSGESKRMKIRARWYSELDDSFLDTFVSKSQIFNFEVKRKFNNISDKLNIGEIKFHKKDEYDSRLNSIQTDLNSICSNHPILSAFNLVSTVFTNYEREYYQLNSDNKIRLTVDKNISYCNSRAITNPMLMSKDYLIVELKFDPEFRKKVNALLINFPFRQTRSSKFLSSIAQIQRVSY